MTIQSGYTKAAAANWDVVFGRRIDFWRIGSQDSQRDIDYAVEEWLECWAGVPVDQIPMTVEVEGYQSIPKDPPQCVVDSMLEDIYERLDGGDPEVWTKPPADIRKLAAEFLTKVYRSYGAADAKLVCTYTVDVKEWIRSNKPEWLEP